MPRYRFNPPPGWPAPPDGWRPPPGWEPDPSWPDAPAGWMYWSLVPPSRWRRIGLTALGVVGALAIVGVVAWIVVAPSLSDRGITVPAGAQVPEFATIDDAVAYYEQQKSDAQEFVAETPFGYDHTRLETLVSDLDDAVDREERDLFPDPDVIARAGYRVAGVVRDFENQHEGWREVYGVKPELAANVSGTAAEAALDRVSGGVSDIRFDRFCGTSDEALACVGPGTIVHVPRDLEEYTDEMLRFEFGDFWESVMTHEFAHVMQNKYGFRLADDPTYRRLFVAIDAPAGLGPDVDYPAEHSADCMAMTVLDDYVPGYPGECTDAQLEFAATIWDGSFYED